MSVTNSVKLRSAMQYHIITYLFDDQSPQAMTHQNDWSCSWDFNQSHEVEIKRSRQMPKTLHVVASRDRRLVAVYHDPCHWTSSLDVSEAGRKSVLQPHVISVFIFEGSISVSSKSRNSNDTDGFSLV